jgi:hypothetical protein
LKVQISKFVDREEERRIRRRGLISRCLLRAGYGESWSGGS